MTCGGVESGPGVDVDALDLGSAESDRTLAGPTVKGKDPAQEKGILPVAVAVDVLVGPAENVRRA